jgi:hypothetical protein
MKVRYLESIVKIISFLDEDTDFRDYYGYLGEQ